jgi:hypothetical protein
MRRAASTRRGALAGPGDRRRRLPAPIRPVRPAVDDVGPAEWRGVRIVYTDRRVGGRRAVGAVLLPIDLWRGATPTPG